MKKSILIITALILLFSSGLNVGYAADVYIFNAKINEDISWPKVILGAATSFFIHELGHVVAAEYTECDYEIAGLSKIRCDPETDYQGRMTARGGFVLQHGVGVLLRTFKGESSFTLGYTTLAALQTITYPIRRHDAGDFHALRKHGGG